MGHKSANITQGRMADLLGGLKLELPEGKPIDVTPPKKTVKVKLKPGKRRPRKKCINRFGQPAIFEKWIEQGFKPDNHFRICALCGREPLESTTWKAPNGKIYRICPECFADGKNSGNKSFVIRVPRSKIKEPEHGKTATENKKNGDK